MSGRAWSKLTDTNDGVPTRTYLLAIFLILDWVDGTAWLRREGEVKLGVLTEAARVTQERILLIVVYGPTTDGAKFCVSKTNITGACRDNYDDNNNKKIKFHIAQFPRELKVFHIKRK